MIGGKEVEAFESVWIVDVAEEGENCHRELGIQTRG
jgi:hypothetical protein